MPAALRGRASSEIGRREFIEQPNLLRLFLELRDKQSLAYQVSPISNESPEPGIFAFYIGCSPEKWDKSIAGIRGEIDKIIAHPMPAKESWPSLPPE